MAKFKMTFETPEVPDGAEELIEVIEAEAQQTMESLGYLNVDCQVV
jgi:hypothetical protein